MSRKAWRAAGGLRPDWRFPRRLRPRRPLKSQLCSRRRRCASCRRRARPRQRPTSSPISTSPRNTSSTPWSRISVARPPGATSLFISTRRWQTPPTGESRRHWDLPGLLGDQRDPVLSSAVRVALDSRRRRWTCSAPRQHVRPTEYRDQRIAYIRRQPPRTEHIPRPTRSTWASSATRASGRATTLTDIHAILQRGRPGAAICWPTAWTRSATCWTQAPRRDRFLAGPTSPSRPASLQRRPLYEPRAGLLRPQLKYTEPLRYR